MLEINLRLNIIGLVFVLFFVADVWAVDSSADSNADFESTLAPLNLAPSPAAAGSGSNMQEYVNLNGDSGVSGQIELIREKVQNQRWFIGALCALSIVSLTIVLTFLGRKQHSGKDIIAAAGLNLIVFGTIILVLVVETDEQLTAAIGVLGAVAGYLFRSMQEQSGEASTSTGKQ